MHLSIYNEHIEVKPWLKEYKQNNTSMHLYQTEKLISILFECEGGSQQTDFFYFFIFRLKSDRLIANSTKTKTRKKNLIDEKVR